MTRSNKLQEWTLIKLSISYLLPSALLDLEFCYQPSSLRRPLRVWSFEQVSAHFPAAISIDKNHLITTCSWSFLHRPRTPSPQTLAARKTHFSLHFLDQIFFLTDTSNRTICQPPHCIKYHPKHFWSSLSASSCINQPSISSPNALRTYPTIRVRCVTSSSSSRETLQHGNSIAGSPLVATLKP